MLAMSPESLALCALLGHDVGGKEEFEPLKRRIRRATPVYYHHHSPSAENDCERFTNYNEGR